jgi:hypothetical protein
MVTATTTALTTTTKVEGDVCVTWQQLAAAGEDGWWRRISLSLSADFLWQIFVSLFLVFVWCATFAYNAFLVTKIRVTIEH